MLLQFVLCLTIALVAISVEHILTLIIGTEPAAQLQILTVGFQNPLIAGLYLSAPYLFMLYIDLRARKKIKEQEKLQAIETENLGELTPVGQETSSDIPIQTTSEETQVYPHESNGRMNFLFGTSVICFLFAIFTFWFGNIISNLFLSISYKLLYAAIFVIIGAILLGLGCVSPGTQEQVSACLEEELSHINNEYVEPTKTEPTNIPETPIPEFNEPFAKEPIEQGENPIETQIQEPSEIEPEIEKYDVRHPKDIVDSQC